MFQGIFRNHYSVLECYPMDGLTFLSVDEQARLKANTTNMMMNKFKEMNLSGHLEQVDELLSPDDHDEE